MENTISELEKALKALRESEEMMRYIVRHDPNAIAIYDCNLNYIAVSERYLKDYRVKEEAIIGRHHYDVFPEMPQRWKDIHQRCLAGEILGNDDDYFERSDGSITYNRWECRPWHRMSGEIGGMITYTEVTTERKEAEIRLQKSEEKYRYLFSHNPQPMWIFDVESLKFIEVNNAAVKHYGYSREEFLQMTVKDIRPPEDISFLLESIAQEEDFKNPSNGIRHVRKNGEIIYVEITAYPVEFNGVAAYHVLIKDITKRRLAEKARQESETKYRVFFENSKDAILLSGPDGQILSANRAACTMFGYMEQELINIGRKGLVDSTDTRLPHLLAERQVKGNAHGEVIFIRKDGTRILTEVASSLFINTEGSEQSSEIIRDITDKKKIQQEIEFQNKLLDQVGQSIIATDNNGMVTYWNKAAEKMYGWTAQEAHGKNIIDLTPANSSKPEAMHILREIQKGNVWSGELMVRRKDGTNFPAYITDAQLLDEFGNLVGIIGISSDITEQKLIKDRLKESEERFRTVAQGITDVIYECNLAHQIKWYGDIDQLMGYLPGEFPRNFEGIKELAHPEDRQYLVYSLEQLFNDGISNCIEYRLKKKTGEWCWWSAKRILMKDKNGKPIKLIGSITDITEQKKIKDEIKFQADLLNNVGQAVVATDNDGLVTYWNKTAEKMYGYPVSKALGENIMDLNSTVISDETIQEIVEKISSGNAWSGELQVNRNDGVSFPVYVTNSPIYGVNGQLSGIVSISSDITQIKKTEEKALMLSKAFEQTVDSIVITDRRGRIQYVNPSFEEMTGYKPGEIMGKTPGFLKSGLYDPGFYEKMWSTILSGKVFRTEMVNKNKNGELYHIEKTISPIFDRHNDITHFVGTGVNISARKNAETELIRAKEKAEESDRLKSAFLANMSHEVRTPLNSILGFSSLLSDPDFDQEQRDEFISHIVKNGNALLNVISDIVDISKIEAGEITIHKSQINLRKFINGVHQQFSFQATEKSLEFMLNLTAHAEDIYVTADPDRLSQVYSNLVGNALKFTHQGILEIGYQLNDNEVICFVRDTGIGIPHEYHEKIFYRFRQVEEEKTRKYGGNGLGLAITKHLVELMGGHIWLESEPGIGSTFYFTLPRFKAQEWQ